MLRWHAAGSPEDVKPAQLPPLPDEASATMRRVAEFYALVLGLRRWADMPDPDSAPFAVDWIARKLGLPSVSVSRALTKLNAAGVIVWNGETMRNPRTRLWVPGELPLAVPERTRAVERLVRPAQALRAEPQHEAVEVPAVVAAEVPVDRVAVPAAGRLLASVNRTGHGLDINGDAAERIRKQAARPRCACPTPRLDRNERCERCCGYREATAA